MTPLLCFAWSLLAAAAPSAEELEERIVRARVKMDHGYVRYRVTSRGTSLGRSRSFTREVEARFDGPKLFFDGTWFDLNGAPVGRSCCVVASAEFLRYTEGMFNGRMAPFLYMPEDADGENRDLGFAVHPRLLGIALIEYDMTAEQTLERWFRDSTMRGEVAAVELEGRELLKLTLRPEERYWGVMEYWVDPSEDYIKATVIHRRSEDQRRAGRVPHRATDRQAL